VTDANLVLNRLSAGAPLAGRIGLDRDLAHAAVQRLGSRIGLATEDLAAGIVRIAVGRMVSAIKQISIANGHDPRDFTLLPYGGAGPMHAAAIADELEMTRVLIPVGPGNFAAFGSLISDLRRDYARTRTTVVTESAATDIEAMFQAIEAQARDELLADDVAADRIVLHRAAGMRYVGQSWELHVDLPPHETSTDVMQAAFAEVHDRRFGHRSRGAVEIVTFRVTAVGRVDKPALPPWTIVGTADQASIEIRDVWFDDGFRSTPILDRARLGAGTVIAGPAILEESGSTTLVPPSWSLRVLDHGDLLMERHR
jgi:N-methylhydantoinase A